MRRKSVVRIEIDKYKKELLAKRKKDLLQPIPTDSFFRIANTLGYDRYTDDHAHWPEMLDDECKFKLILEPVGTFKSTTAILYCIRETIRNPDVTIAYFSKSREIPAETAGVVRGHLEKLGFRPKTGWTLTKFSVSNRSKSLREPTFRALSINSRFTGIHPDIIICDDIVGLEDFRSAKERERVKDQYNALLQRMTAYSKVIMIGTCWHHDDLYSDIIKNSDDNGFKVWVTPAINDDGSARYPSILPLERLAQIKARTPLRIIYNSQYLLDPTPTDEKVFGEPQFFAHDEISYNTAAKRHFKGLDMLYPVAYIDPSTTTGGDDTACVFGLWHTESKSLYIIDLLVGQHPAESVVEWIKKCNSKGLRNCYIEVTGNQLHYLRLIKHIKGDLDIAIMEWKNSINKVLRLATFAYYVNQGNVRFSKGLEHTSDFLKLKKQMIDFPSGAHDDAIDALEGCFAVGSKFTNIF